MAKRNNQKTIKEEEQAKKTYLPGKQHYKSQTDCVQTQQPFLLIRERRLTGLNIYKSLIYQILIIMRSADDGESSLVKDELQIELFIKCYKYICINKHVKMFTLLSTNHSWYVLIDKNVHPLISSSNRVSITITYLVFGRAEPIYGCI